MEKDSVALVCLTTVALVSIIGIFKTKTPGWGKYTSSTLILTLALFIAASLLVLGRLEAPPVANILFAIVGYAGGLIASNIGSKCDTPAPQGSSK